MSLNVADLVGTLKIDKTAWNNAIRGLPSDVERGGGKAERSAAAVGSGIAGRLSSSFKQTVIGGAVTGAVAGVFQSATNLIGMGIQTAFTAAKAAVFDFNSTLEQADIGFTTMLGSGAKSKAFLGQLKDFAKATPFEFEGLVKNAQSLMGMGVAAKDVIPTLTALGDSTAAVGGDANMLNNTILAWGQTVSKGTLSMDNMNQLLQGGMPQALKILAAQYGVTTGKMVEMISTGKVQSSEALPKLIKGIEKGTSATAALGGMMDKQSQTWAGAWSNISDVVTQTLAGTFKPLFSEASKNAQGLATWLSSDQVTQWGAQAQSALKGAMKWFKDTGAAVTEYIMPILGNVVDYGKEVAGGLVSAWGVIGPPIQSAAKAFLSFLGPLLQAKDAVPILVGAFLAYNAAMKAYAAVVLLSKIPMGIAIAQQWLLNAAMTANPIGIVVAAIAGLVAGLVWFFTQTKVGKDAWASFTRFLGEAWANITGFIGDAIKNIGAWLTKWGPTVLLAVAPIIGIPLLIIQHWGDIVKWFQALPGVIGGLVSQAGQWLLGAGKAILVGMATGIALGVIGVKYLFTKFPSDLAGWIAGAGRWLVTTGSDILKGLQSGVVTGYRAVTSWFTSLPRNIANFFTSVGTWILGPGKDLLVGFSKGYLGFWTDIGKWFLSLPGKFVDFFKGVGAWITGPGKDLLVGFSLGYIGFWTDVAKWFLSIPSKVGGFFKGAIGWLKDAGVNVVQGFLNGVSSLAGTIGSFFLSLLPSWIVGPFKAALGIKSPSRVFMQLGKYIGQGLGIGLTSTKSDIADAMSKVIQYVKDGYDKLEQTAKAAQKKLTAAQRRYDAMSGKQKASASGRNLADTIAGYKDDIAANKANKGGKAEKALLKQINADNADLQAAAKRRDGIADRLATANDNLVQAQNDLADFAKNVKDGAIAAGSVTDQWSKTNDEINTATQNITDLQDQLAGLDTTADDYSTKSADLATKIAAQQTIKNQSPVAAMIANLQKQVNQDKEFKALLAQLKAEGLDDGTYQQLVGAGVEAGLATAQAISQGGPEAVRQIADLQSQLSTAAGALGDTTAQTLYGAGVAMKQGIVDGLKSDMSNVNEAISVLQSTVTLDLYQAGLVSKSAAVAAGNNILQGMADGARDGKKNSDLDKALAGLSKGDILDAVKVASGAKAKSAGQAVLDGIRQGLDDKDKNSALDKALKSLGKKMVTTLKKELKIKSPSGAFRDEVGQFIPPGIVDGIDKTSGALDARITDLVTIPGVQGLGSTAGGRGAYGGGLAYSPSASVVVYGNVGWDPEEVADRMRDTQNTQAALAGLDALVPA